MRKDQTLVLFLSLISFLGTAQVKVGINPNTIDANANLQVEGTGGLQTIFRRDNGRLGVGTLSPTERLHVIGNALFDNPSSDLSFSRINSAGNVTTQMGSSSSTSTFGAGGFVGTVTNHPLNFLVNNLPVVQLTDEHLSPNNLVGGELRSLGTSVNRWDLLYSYGGIDAFNSSANTTFSRYRTGDGVDSRIGSYNASSPFPALGRTMFVGTFTNDPISFFVNNTPIARLTGSAYIPIASSQINIGSSTNRWGNIFGGQILEMAATSQAVVYSRYTSNQGVISQIGSSDNSTNFGASTFIGSFSDHPVTFISNNQAVAKMFINSFVPSADGVMQLGSGIARWASVWSVNGSIQTSDRRLKTNIQPLEYGLADLMKLEAVSFDWKDKSNDKTKLGFIAQDLQKVLPELVVGKETKDDFLGLNYGELTPVLVKAIQEQQALIEKLLKLNEAQDQKISLLQAEIAKVVSSASTVVKSQNSK